MPDLASFVRGLPKTELHMHIECRTRGFRTTIHAGEEGPASYVRQAIELLRVDRIDHGNAAWRTRR